MSNITVVTTFHQKGLEKYGQRFINSFAEKVDKKINMLVYAEDCNPVNPDESQIKILDAKAELPKLNFFKEKWKNDPKANGKCPWPERRPRDYHKEFKWDAVRFANKVYAVFDACERVGSGWVVWMDADTFVHTKWTYDEFCELLPADKWLTYVGRGKNATSWPECGFYGLNLENLDCKSFLKEFESYYNDAETKMFTLDEWHDSYIFGVVLEKYKKFAPNVLDYTANLELRTAKTGGGAHPLINSKLGKWIDHMKGDRKNIGKSKTTDIVVNHNNPYWQ
jgi:hypothetical protein